MRDYREPLALCHLVHREDGRVCRVEARQCWVHLDAPQAEVFRAALDLLEVAVLRRVDGHEPDVLVGVPLRPLGREVVGTLEPGRLGPHPKDDGPVDHLHAPGVRFRRQRLHGRKAGPLHRFGVRRRRHAPAGCSGCERPRSCDAPMPNRPPSPPEYPDYRRAAYRPQGALP